jgi:hypothetical protein
VRQDAPRKDGDDKDDEVTEGLAGMAIGGNAAAGAAAPAPFTFTPAPKGQSPFGAGGAAPMFSFPGGAGAGAGAAPGAGAGAPAPNFSFNFAAPSQAEKKAGGDDKDEDDDDDDEDPVEMFIKSLPEPVQKCVAALDSIDEEVCELEAQFRKEMRALERKVTICSSAAGFAAPQRNPTDGEKGASHTMHT